MNQLQKEKLEQLVEDELLVDGLREIFESIHEEEIRKLNTGHTNLELGENIKALLTGKELLNRGFKKLLSFKKVVEKTQTKNNAL